MKAHHPNKPKSLLPVSLQPIASISAAINQLPASLPCCQILSRHVQSVVDSQLTPPALFQDFVFPFCPGLRRRWSASSFGCHQCKPSNGSRSDCSTTSGHQLLMFCFQTISPLTAIVVCLFRPHPIESRLNTNPEPNKLKTYCFQFKCNRAK